MGEIYDEWRCIDGKFIKAGVGFSSLPCLMTPEPPKNYCSSWNDQTYHPIFGIPSGVTNQYSPKSPMDNLPSYPRLTSEVQALFVVPQVGKTGEAGNRATEFPDAFSR